MSKKFTFDEIVAGYGLLIVTGPFYKKREHRPLKMTNGVTISVQAGMSYDCLPRDDTGPYTHVELESASVTPPRYILDYIEYPNCPWRKPVQHHYLCVPVDLVRQWIDECNGESG